MHVPVRFLGPRRLIFWGNPALRPSAQPCKTEAVKCPQYAPAKPAHYVLELAGGMAKKYNLELGQEVEW